MNTIELNRVHYMPKELEPEILYISDEFGVAGHMCPCGCGNKIITPLGPTDWSLKVIKNKPTLYPSIGNWQLPCKSHYWIKNGLIEWSYQWTEKQISAGQQYEEDQRQSYYDNLDHKKKRASVFVRILNWIFRKIKSIRREGSP